MALRPEVYLDNNATTEPLPEVREAVAQVLSSGPLNPSSVHSQGDRARRFLKTARAQVADLVRSDAANVVFTSGATESNHLVLVNLLTGGFQGFRFVTTATEHSSIREAVRSLEQAGVNVTLLPVGADGRVDALAVGEAIDPGRTLVSVHWANNETGVLQPLEDIAEVCRERGAVLHSDAVQAVGKIDVDLRRVPVDLLSLSGHKLHGPLGVGAIVARDPSRLRTVLPGGGQEAGVRPGTENLPAIVGFGTACALRQERWLDVALHTLALRDGFEARLSEAGVIEDVAGADVPRLPNTSNVRFTRVDGEALLLRLDQAGVCCSQGSACTNRKPEPSYVLRAMGRSEEEAFRCLRFSFSEFNTEEEVQVAIDELVRLHAQLSTFFTEHPVG